MDIYEVFNELRYHHEDEVVEFKKAENNFDFDDLGKHFSALSNEANLRDKAFAWLVFGVENKTREAIGTTYKNSMTSLQKLKHDLAQHTTDRNTFRDIFELKVDGKRVLMFQVPAAPRGIPMGWQGHFYARQGESLVALDTSKYEEIRRQTAVEDWSKKIVDGATMDDLDPEIAHQDYGCQGMINIVEEEDRLIFTNMGRFIPDSVRSVLVNDAPEEHYRNKMLANAMVELGMVDTIGSGIKRMFDKQRERLFPMPDYDFRDNRVKVTIVGKVLDVDYAMLLNKLPEALTEKQKLSKIGNLLTYLRKNGKIELLENKMWARKFS